MTTTALFHVERGSGTPVLALHGWEPDHRLMSGCLEPVLATRPGYRRLYPDLPGMGATPAAGVRSSDDVLASVERFIDEVVGEQQLLLVGESYGGYVARALVRARPNQVLGLALLCPVARLEPADRTVPQHEALAVDPGVLDDEDPELTASFAAMSVVHTSTTLRRYRDEIQVGVQTADADALARIRRRWRLSLDPDTTEGPPFTGPTLILAGRQDASVGFVDQLGLLPQFPRATLAVLDLAGHNLQIEQPVLFDALVGEWLDRVAGAPERALASDE